MAPAVGAVSAEAPDGERTEKCQPFRVVNIAEVGVPTAADDQRAVPVVDRPQRPAHRRHIPGGRQRVSVKKEQQPTGGARGAEVAGGGSPETLVGLPHHGAAETQPVRYDRRLG